MRGDSFLAHAGKGRSGGVGGQWRLMGRACFVQLSSQFATIKLRSLPRISRKEEARPREGGSEARCRDSPLYDQLP